MCASVLYLATVEENQLQNWLRHVILGSNGTPTPPPPTTTTVTNGETQSTASIVTLAVSDPNATTTATSSTTTPKVETTEPAPKKNLLEENQFLLQYLTVYIVKDNK